MEKVAIITGAASGIGLSIAKALADQDAQNWHVHLIDRNIESGEAAASTLRNATFHPCDITDYSLLSSIFHAVHKKHRRLDFVHANAGIRESVDFYAEHDISNGPPPPIDRNCIDVDLTANIETAYLAMHYFRKNDKAIVPRPNVVITASMLGLYGAWSAPIYSPAKHGLVGFIRSVAPRFLKEGIRVNGVCPGAVMTNIMTQEIMGAFPDESRTPVENIASTVLKLIGEVDVTDSKGMCVTSDYLTGKVVEVSRDKFYFVEGGEPVDEASALVLKIICQDVDPLLRQN